MPTPPIARFTVCGSAVKFTLTTTWPAPGACRIQLNTLMLSVSSMMLAPRSIAGTVFFNWIRLLYQASNERGSFVCAATLIVFALGGTGSHGSPVVNPALSLASHCIGVRSPSRPFSFGHPVTPMGSFTSCLRFGGVVFMPISSP